MRLLVASALLALAAGTAAAQTETPAPLGSAGVAAPDAAAAPASPAAGRRQPRRVDGAGSAADPTAAKPAVAKADSAESLHKAQSATAARDKAWDVRMKRTLGSICHGC